MRTQRLLTSLKGHVLLVLAFAIVGAIAAAMLAEAQAPTYESTARIAIGPAETIADENDRIQVGHVLNQRVVPANLSELLVSDRVLSSALAASGLTPADIEDDAINATVAPDSNVVYVSIVSSDPARPGRLIAPLTTSGIELFEEIYSVYRAEVIQLDQGADQTAPLSPVVGGLVGLVVGLVAAVYLALLIDNSDAGRLDTNRRRIEDPTWAAGDVSRVDDVDQRPDESSRQASLAAFDVGTPKETGIAPPLTRGARRLRSPATTGEFVIVGDVGDQPTLADADAEQRGSQF